MLISFFSPTDFTTWVDHSSHPDLIYQEDIEINLDTHIPVLIEEDGEYHIEIEEKSLPPETHEQKVARISSLLISEEDYEAVDTEWVIGFDIDSMVVARFFGGDRGKEMWYSQRFSYLIAFGTKEDSAEIEFIKNKYLEKIKYIQYLKTLNEWN